MRSIMIFSDSPIYFIFFVYFERLGSKNLFCSVDMPLYYNNIATIATISSKVPIEVFAAPFSCSNTCNLSQSSMGIQNKNLVKQSFGFDFLRKLVLIAGG